MRKTNACVACGRLLLIGLLLTFICPPFPWPVLDGFALGRESEPQVEGDEVAATVNGVPILVAEVDLRVRRSLGQRKATEEAMTLLRAEALQQLIEQRKVLAQLRKRGEASSRQELEREWQRLADQLARQEKTIDDHCQTLGIPPAALRRMLEWQQSWQRCCEKYLTDEHLEQYFEQHQREFDGTELRVAQILLRADDRDTRQQLVQRASEIRAEILAGEMTFAEAARRYSESPSARQGGELDWIGREAPMPEFFAAAAFALDEGQVSAPVESPYGVHLIQCIEIRPGRKRWRDVRDSLHSAVAEYLFDWLAAREETQHDVQFTGRTPHFLPGTRQLTQTPDGSHGKQPAEERK